MHRLGGRGNAVLVEDDGDFDFGGRDHLDVEAACRQQVEQLGRHTGVRTHADADHAELGHAGRLCDPESTDFRGHSFEHRARLDQFVAVRGEGNVRRSLVWRGLHDDVHHHISRGQRVENFCRRAGLVRHALDGDFRLVAFDADAADDDVLHAWCFCFHDGSRVLVETAADFEKDVELVGKLDRARLHYFGP